MRLVLKNFSAIIIITNTCSMLEDVMSNYEDNYISLGEEFDYVQYVYYNGIKYYNKDYKGDPEDNIILLKLS